MSYNRKQAEFGFGQCGLKTVKLSDLFKPSRALRRELSEFLSACYLCAKVNSSSFVAELTEFDAELGEFLYQKQQLSKQHSACFL